MLKNAVTALKYSPTDERKAAPLDSKAELLAKKVPTLFKKTHPHRKKADSTVKKKKPTLLSAILFIHPFLPHCYCN